MENHLPMLKLSYFANILNKTTLKYIRTKFIRKKLTRLIRITKINSHHWTRWKKVSMCFPKIQHWKSVSIILHYFLLNYGYGSSTLNRQKFLGGGVIYSVKTVSLCNILNKTPLKTKVAIKKRTRWIKITRLIFHLWTCSEKKSYRVFPLNMALEVYTAKNENCSDTLIDQFYTTIFFSRITAIREGEVQLTLNWS